MAEAGIHLLVDTIENADAQFHQQKQYFVASMHSLMRVLFQGKELAAKNVGAYTEIGRGGEVLAEMEEGQEENREETVPDPSREEQGGGVELEHGFLAEEIGGAVEEAGGAVEEAAGAVEEAGGALEEAGGALEIERNVDEDEATIPEPVAEELEADLNVEQATAVTIPETDRDELDVAMEPIAEPSPEALVGSLEPEENLSSGEQLEEEHPDQEEVDQAAELQHDISDPEREDRCEVEAIEQTIEQTIEEHLSEQVEVDDDDSTDPTLDSNEVEQANEEPEPEPEPEPEELVADEPEYDFSSQNREDPTAVGRDSLVDRRREDSLEEQDRTNSFSFVRPGSFSFTEPERERSFSFVKPGREDGLVEPEREDSFIDPGREDSLVESRQEYSIEQGGEADLIEPSRGDSLVDPGREETGGAAVDQERIQAEVLPEPDREEQVGEVELIIDRDNVRADSQPGREDRSEADRIVDGDDDQGYAVHEEGGGGSISVQTNLVSNLRSFLPLVKKADTTKRPLELKQDLERKKLRLAEEQKRRDEELKNKRRKFDDQMRMKKEQRIEKERQAARRRREAEQNKASWFASKEAEKKRREEVFQRMKMLEKEQQRPLEKVSVSIPAAHHEVQREQSLGLLGHAMRVPSGGGGGGGGGGGLAQQRKAVSMSTPRKSFNSKMPPDHHKRKQQFCAPLLGGEMVDEDDEDEDQGPVSYEISPYKNTSSDDDDDDDKENKNPASRKPKKPVKPIPRWASKENLLPQLVRQAQIDPDKIFRGANSCSLNEVFGTTGNKKRTDFSQRKGSGDWIADIVTWKEELNYKKSMGFL